MSTMNLEFDSRQARGWHVLGVRGEVDIYTAPALRERLLQALEASAHRVVLDLSGVSFMDSTGLAVLIVGLKRVKEHGGELRLAVPGDAVRKPITMTGLDQVFSIFETVDEALAA